jgi:hypothetical protein
MRAHFNMVPIFRAIISKGKIVLDKVGLFNDYLTLLEGKNIDVIVRRHKKNRSIPQNNFYWGVCIKLLCEETGYSDDEMHDALKMLFLQDRNRQIPTLRSTASLTTVEFEEYLEKVRQWAAQELSCVIPLPNEIDFEHSEAPVSPPVDSETLANLFSLASKKKVIEICKREFGGRLPEDLTEREASALDTMIITEQQA